jgi:DNA-binding response OmpR family regulator
MVSRMSNRPIIFLGKPGLEAQIFQAYMQSSGFRVQVGETLDSALAALRTTPRATTVIALDEPAAKLTEVARTLQRAGQVHNPIFILAGEQVFDPRLPSVYVVPRPFRLAEVIRRIQSLDRDDA